MKMYKMGNKSCACPWGASGHDPSWLLTGFLLPASLCPYRSHHSCSDLLSSCSPSRTCLTHSLYIPAHLHSAWLSGCITMALQRSLLPSWPWPSSWRLSDMTKLLPLSYKRNRDSFHEVEYFCLFSVSMSFSYPLRSKRCSGPAEYMLYRTRKRGEKCENVS